MLSERINRMRTLLDGERGSKTFQSQVLHSYTQNLDTAASLSKNISVVMTMVAMMASHTRACRGLLIATELKNPH